MATEQKRMRQLYSTDAEWDAANPMLLEGETAYSGDIRQFKVGPGFWRTLPYWDNLPALPNTTRNHGNKDGVWSQTVDALETYSGDLNSFPGEHVKFARVTAPMSNAWEGAASSDSSFLMHNEDQENGNATQIGFAYSPAGNSQPHLYTRSRRGSAWSEWITYQAFSQSPYTGPLGSLATGTNVTFALGVTVGSGATGGWDNMVTDDIVLTYNIAATRARQVGFSKIDGKTYSRVYAGGSWGEWTAAQVNESDIIDLDRVRWRYPYVNGTAYEKNDMVLDGSWTMIANKDTTERASPQEDGEEEYDISADIPAWQTFSHAGVVQSGRAYANVEPITLIGYQVWVPVLNDDTNYVIRKFLYPTGDQSQIVYEEISEPLLVEDQWTTIEVSRVMIPAGNTFGVVINALNSGSSTLVTGGWQRRANSNDLAADPAVGGWGTANNQGSLRISFEDADGTDRTTEVMGMVAGTVVTFANTSNPNESMSWTIGVNPTNEGTHAGFATVVYDGTGVEGEPGVGQITTMTATVPVASPTDYVVLLDSNPTLSWGTAAPLLEFDGVSQPVAQQAFGVRVLTDTWTVSPDWDIVSIAGGAAGGGGSGGEGGVTEFALLTDTPANYTGAGGQTVRVKDDETGLEFGDTGAFVPLDGSGTMTGALKIDAGLADAIRIQVPGTNLGRIAFDNTAGDAELAFIEFDAANGVYDFSVMTTQIGRVEADPTAEPAFNYSLMTRAKSDARYWGKGFNATDELVNLNIDEGTEYGFYQTTPTTANRPLNLDTDSNPVIVAAADGTHTMQILGDHFNDRIWTRTQTTGNTWSRWSQVVTFDPTTETGYLPLSGGTLTGTLDVEANFFAKAIVSTGVSSAFYSRYDGNKAQYFQSQDGTVNKARSIYADTPTHYFEMGVYDYAGTNTLSNKLRIYENSVRFYAGDMVGGEIARIDGAGTDLPNAVSLVSRQAGDARYLKTDDAGGTYLPLTGGTLTGPLVISGQADPLTFRGDGQQYIQWLNTSGDTVAQIRYHPGDNILELASYIDGVKVNRARIHPDGMLFFGPGSSSIAARVVDPVGTTLSLTTSLVTREKGDARWLKIADYEDDKQNWSHDTTAGRILLVGAYGHGGSTANAPDNDLDNMTYGGLFHADTGHLNKPPGSSNWIVWNGSRTTTIHAQMAISRATATRGLMAVRAATTADGWSDWEYVLSETLADDIYVRQDGTNHMTDALRIHNGGDTGLILADAAGAGYGTVFGSGANGSIGLRTYNASEDVMGRYTISADGNHTFYSVDNTLSARIEPAGTDLPLATSLVSREKGDNRYLKAADAGGTYLPLTGGTLTGTLNVDAATNLNGTTIIETSSWAPLRVQISGGNSDGQQLFYQGSRDGSALFEIRHIPLENMVRLRASIDHNLEIMAWSGQRLRADWIGTTDLPSTFSGVTRDRGDARYAKLSGATMTGSLVLSKDNTDALVLKRSAGDEFLGMMWKTGSIKNWLTYMSTDSSGDLIWAPYTDEGDPQAYAMKMQRNGRVVNFDKVPTVDDVPLLTPTVADGAYLRTDGTNHMTDALQIHNGGDTGLILADAAGAGYGTIFGSGANGSIGLRTYNASEEVMGRYTISADGNHTFYSTDNTLSARIEPAGTDLPLATSLVSREKGDARYLKTVDASGTYLPLAGGTLTGPLNGGAANFNGNIIAGLNSGGVALTINDGYGNASVTWNHVFGVPEQDGNAARISVNTDSSTDVAMSFQMGEGVTEGVAKGCTLVGQFNDIGGTVLSTDTVIVTRQSGDARYVEMAGDVMTGYLSINYSEPRLYLNATGTSTGLMRIGSSRTDSGDSILDLAGDTTYTTYGLRVSRTAGAGGPSILAHRGSGNLRLNSVDTGPITFYLNNTFAAQMVDPVGTDLSTTSSVATREKGDARWLQIADYEGEKQTSAEDTTAGSLMLVGAFGNGGYAGATPDGDLNGLTYGGMFLADSDTLNKPTGSLNWIIWSGSRTSTISAQMAISRATNTLGRMAVRARANATYSDWEFVVYESAAEARYAQKSKVEQMADALLAVVDKLGIPDAEKEAIRRLM